uniref:SMP-30/Gluconolactonase/LRE-like region domain-containing protein n=1 Tax=Rhodosorus marinus TaxID=101924 RepID=A0A7S0BNX9_9RHOD|mmetsp:Transcript_2620/g.3817  ORF Transcript_2620/g.3817 Transcript_2620/m.3817 type:complete len:351 (+) Transcript_2620:187-1239(+)|eukprot:CAMPEP_0184738824 /NCGR_PEP_ID=MMETSP0315-20130426/1517_1 /TAXON_ID=101924 /ORGANISM="Rhodosorus marinus, Strain UTEX LB 2760" /LENGTH=350 /DNA_ID=CAMNT_0027206893 /DNA_START=104 /DNA_END=1156 /DNA_ORIENTATION=+
MKLTAVLVLCILGIAHANLIAVAVRGAGTLDIIDPLSGIVVNSLPAGVLPGYVTNIGRNIYSSDSGSEYIYRFYVNDNNTVVENGRIPVRGCEGGFHMISTQDFTTRRFLAVTCSGSKNTFIVNPENTAVKQIIPVPKFPSWIDSSTAEPHDVVLNGRFIYITYLKLVSLDPKRPNPGFVVQYNAFTYEELNRVRTVSDPHVNAAGSSDLFVAAQSGTVAEGTAYQVNPTSMDIVEEFQTRWTSSAHGIVVSPDLERLYVGNIINQEVGIVTFDLTVYPMKKLCRVTMTAEERPHNLAVSNGFLFIASVSSDLVTRFELLNGKGCPVQATETFITVAGTTLGIADIDVSF